MSGHKKPTSGREVGLRDAQLSLLIRILHFPCWCDNRVEIYGTGYSATAP